MKVLLVGCGRWGRNIAKTLSEANLLAGIVEECEGIRVELRKNFPNVLILESLETVEPSKFPAVALATPVLTHYKIARQLLENGHHVFVEKPITLEVSHARDLCELADRVQRCLMVGHLLIHQPAIHRIKDWVESEKIGKLASVHQRRLNFGTVRSAENSLWSLGVHDVAVLLSLLNEAPVDIQASAQAILQANIADDYHLNLRFNSGVQTHLHVSWMWPKKSRGLTIIGTSGMITYDEIKQELRLHFKRVNDQLQTQQYQEDLVEEFKDGNPLLNEMQHFVDCCVNGTKPASDGWQGLRVVEILSKADELVATRQFQNKNEKRGCNGKDTNTRSQHRN